VPDNPRLLFASYHAYLDHASGAALATRDLFEDLAAHGWNCRVVCGPKFDHPDGRRVGDVLRERQLAHHVERCAPARGRRYELFHYTLNGVPVTQYQPEDFNPAVPPSQDEGIPFLDVVSRAQVRQATDVVLTYGGLPVGPHLIARVRRRGARVLFCLHNLDYRDRALFEGVDAVSVPSEFVRAAYRERLGLETHAVPFPWDHARVLTEPAGEGHVTFVNPVPPKGVTWFARIALEVSRRRPDIPFLVVEGRGPVEGLGRLPLDLSELKNLRGMRSTPHPSEFYALSRVVLVPSLCEDSFPRVGCEALANGLPVLATRRGGLPDVLGGAGFLFDVPTRYTVPAGMTEVPTADEVSGWVGVIERLWEDAPFYAEHRAKALARATAWEPDRVRPGVEAFLRGVAGR
jgi:glycosyltransferase involved in cell wall biosynthesis